MKHKMSLLLTVFMCLSQVLQPVVAEEITVIPEQIITETQNTDEHEFQAEVQQEDQSSDEKQISETTISYDDHTVSVPEEETDPDNYAADYEDQTSDISYDYTEDEITEETPHYLVFASDRHGWAEGVAATMGNIPAFVDPDHVEYVSMIGDMVNSGSYQSAQVLSEIQNVFGPYINASIVWGTHDSSVIDDAGIVYGQEQRSSRLIYTGKNVDETTAYYVYGIAFYDMASYSNVSYSAVINNARYSAGNFREWVSSLPPEDNAPIIVLCHAPMHTFRGDNVGASFWNEALNYAATKGTEAIQRQVVFLHGHNHTYDETEYYYEPGSTVSIQQPVNGESGSEEEISYTYITAGYMRGRSTNTRLRNATLVNIINNGAIEFTKFTNGEDYNLGLVKLDPLYLDLITPNMEFFQGAEYAQISYKAYYGSEEVEPDSVYFIESDDDGIISDISEDGVITFSGNPGSAIVTVNCSYGGFTAESGVVITVYPVHGRCGSDLTYTFDPDSGKMTISGVGPMDSYSVSGSGIPGGSTSMNPAPWYDYRTEIKELVIESGVTSVGSFAFYDCTGLETAVLGKDVLTISRLAFGNCESLECIEIPSGINSIISTTSYRAFQNCSSLADVYFTGTEEEWNAKSFSAGAFITGPEIHYLSVNHMHYGDDEDCICDLCGLQTEYEVLLTSALEGDETGETVAHLQGGGIYKAGESEYGAAVTVIAPYKPGFDFVGWFDTDAAAAEPVSESYTYRFTAYTDVNLTAVYRPTETKFTVSIYAGKFQITGMQGTQYENAHVQVTPGEQVTVTYADPEKKFLYWGNETKKIMSTEQSYTFTAVGDVTLYAYTVSENTMQSEGGAYVVFMTAFNQIIASGTYFADSNIVFPAIPARIGYTSDGWNKTDADIRQLIQNGSTYIVVTPVYTQTGKTSTVIVRYKNNLLPEEEYYPAEGNAVTVTAADIEDYTFACWKDSDDILLSTEQEYKILTSDGSVIYAEYVSAGETPERKPVIALTRASWTQSESANRIVYTATRSLPDGYSVLENGILRSTNSAYGNEDAKNTFVLNAEGVKASKSSDLAANGVYTLNLNVGEQKDTTVYGRGYMVIKDETGEQTVVYSDKIYAFTFNELKNSNSVSNQ